ncbi:MAG: aminotransferase class III-fold pyridoxal phosphate-dependent enzyme, partial [Firmicutes bacterium]|nr:aminotransferase class III-fold pyridoxal phosphate-dependent enzyme [Bacillota bacterium]
HFGVKPDIMTFGKKAQVCGFAASKRIDEVKDNCFQVSSRISATWCSNVLDMIRGTYYINYIVKNNLVDNAAKQGKYMMAELKKLEKDYPGLVMHARGFGMLCAFDLKDGATRDKFADYAMNTEHMIMLGCGTQSIRFRPVLDVTKADLEEGFRRIRRTLDAIK